MFISPENFIEPTAIIGLYYTGVLVVMLFPQNKNNKESTILQHTCVDIVLDFFPCTCLEFFKYLVKHIKGNMYISVMHYEMTRKHKP